MVAQVNINLRLPADLHAALKSLANRDLRSLNAEIVWLLGEAVRNEGDTNDH